MEGVTLRCVLTCWVAKPQTVIVNMRFLTISWVFRCRMYPAAWENTRFLDEDIIIRGYRIPANVSRDVVFFNNGVLSFTESYST